MEGIREEEGMVRRWWEGEREEGGGVNEQQLYR